MNRVEFMEKLEYLLQDIPDQEKADALAYYQDYLEEAGDENEEQVIKEFGSPERVAAIIRSELYGNLEDGGGFTETGYQDERFREPGYQVVEHRDWPDVNEPAGSGRRDGARREDRRSNDSRLMKLLKLGAILIVLAILGPIALGVGSAVLSAAAGIVICLAVLVLVLGIVTVLLCVAAVIVTVVGIGTLFVSPWGGIFLLGGGVFLLGCSLIGIVLSILVYGRLVPFCFRSVADGISRLFHRNRRRAL